MLDDVIGCLACPHCAQAFARDGASLRCANGHSFDVARKGYVSLLRGDAGAGSADTAAMVAAREAFLAAGHLEPLARLVAETCADAAAGVPGCVVDAGAGTGHYLAAVLDRLPRAAGLALDLSKHAARRAARAHPRIGAVVADTWGVLPVRDGAASLVLDVFAPRNAAEFRRVLAPGGALVVVTPTRRHLSEAVEALGLLVVDERKAERLDEQLAGRFARETEIAWDARAALSHADLRALAGMGPSARHVSEEEIGRRAGALPEPFEVTLSAVVGTWRRV